MGKGTRCELECMEHAVINIRAVGRDPLPQRTEQCQFYGSSVFPSFSISIIMHTVPQLRGFEFLKVMNLVSESSDAMDYRCAFHGATLSCPGKQIRTSKCGSYGQFSRSVYTFVDPATLLHQ